ncbi:Purine nucleoside phosphorylase [Brevibacillus laterosporus]|nr:Purine nucleoside phosphorylase [Brevibacillus laterosporus]
MSYGAQQRVVEKSGRDVTHLYIDGAYQTLQLAKQYQATHVVLKENSPSCGSHNIYNGHFSNQRIPGQGVTSALLRQEGFIVISENELSVVIEL